MHPILFEIGSYQVPSYGVALALSFAVGIWVAQRRAGTLGLDAERVVDAGMVALVSSIVGARLLWVVTHLDAFRPSLAGWLDAINPFQGPTGGGVVGMSMLGGVVLAVAATLAYLSWKRMPVLQVADVLAPSIALGEGITRIGCFLNGCCHGLVCDLPWGVRFPPGSGAAALFPGLAVHPTQLYSSASGFGFFVLLSWLLRRKPFDGAVVFSYLVLQGVQRFLIDFVRYYEDEVIIARFGEVPLTINQAIAVVLVLTGALGLAFARRPAAVRPSPAGRSSEA